MCEKLLANLTIEDYSVKAIKEWKPASLFFLALIVIAMSKSPLKNLA
jgi:hypothetical protein